MMKKLTAILLCLMLCAMNVSAEQAGLGMISRMITPEAAFAGPSTEFNVVTAWFMLINCMGQTETDTAQQMNALGMDVIVQKNYNKPVSDHSHTSGFTMGAGQLPVRGEQRNAVIITIRGTSDGEWYSNFDFAGVSGGDCTVAENFYAASEDIYAYVKPELDAIENPVIIVTGYSRGAACANLMGLMLNEDFPMEDVYVYTFATPNTIRGEVDNDGNIFNIVNMNDMITHMPPQAYGFSRAGTDIELRDPEYVNTDMHNMFIMMLGVCPDIDSFYNDRHAVDAPGLSEDGITMCEVFMKFADLTSGDAVLVAEAQEFLGTIMMTENDFTQFMPLFYSAMIGGGDVNQHMPDVYVQLMLQLGFGN